MALVKSSAVILRTHRLGETSKVVVCYTKDFGKVRLVAKGARKGGGRLGAALEPMQVSGVVFYLRQGRDLLLLSQADVERQWPVLRRDVVRMAYAAAALELADVLVSEREEDPRLFDLLERTLDRMASEPPASLDAVLWGYEVSLSQALGYAPQLARCVVCGGPVGEDAFFSSRLGGVVCAGCTGSAPGATPLSEGAAAVLASLSGTEAEEPGGPGESGDPGGPVEPAEPGGPGRAREIPDPVRDEVGDVLLGFLGEHAGRELRLKSLDFLAQIRRTGQYPVEREQEDNG